mmetsp:Transcript_29498/g.89622  ORF Transcript_29498/g.89622 Transcript_29498/m.89622 type:complete len:490 (+) Transcript_29498:1116-2585(+)
MKEARSVTALRQLGSEGLARDADAPCLLSLSDSLSLSLSLSFSLSLSLCPWRPRQPPGLPHARSLLLRAPQLGEARAGRVAELKRRARLDRLPRVHDHHPVALHDGVEPVGDGEHGGVGHLAAQRLLDQLVRLHVDGSGRLVEDENARALEQRPRHADELPLTHRQVGAALVDRFAEPIGVLAHRATDGARVERVPQLRVGRLGEGVEVLAQRAGEEDRVLRDDCEPRAQRRQRHRRDVDSVEEDGARAHLAHPEEGHQDGRLAGAGAADDPDLLARRDVEAEVGEDIGQSRPVAHPNAREADGALGRPRRGGRGRRPGRRFLGLELRVLREPLDGDHHRLERREVAQQIVERVRHARRVRERQAGEAGRRLAASAVCEVRGDGEERREREQEVGQELEPHRQPPIGRVHDEGSARVCVEAANRRLLEARRDAHRGDRRRAVERLGEGGVDGRARDGLEPLQLARRGSVVLCAEEVDDGERQQREEHVL